MVCMCRPCRERRASGRRGGLAATAAQREARRAAMAKISPRLEVVLSEADQAWLAAQPCRRSTGIRAVADGLRVEDVAAAAGLSAGSVRGWVRDWLRVGRVSVGRAVGRPRKRK